MTYNLHINNMAPLKLLLPIVILVTVSCNSKKHRYQAIDEFITIDFQDCQHFDRPLNLSEIASSSEYISLETQPNVLIRSDSYFKITDKYLLIGQGGQIIQFDNQGKFLKNLIKVGRGPGEGFTRCFDIVDFKNQLIMYNNYTHDLVTYNLDNGEIITKVKDPVTDFSTENIFSYKNNLIAVDQKNTSLNLIIMQILISNLNGQIGTRQIKYPGM